MAWGGTQAPTEFWRLLRSRLTRRRLAKLLAIPMAVSIHQARLYEWAAIYAVERKQLLRRAGPVPGSLHPRGPLLPN